MNLRHDGRFLAAPLGSRAFEEAAPPCGSDEWNGSPLGIPVPWGWVVSSSTPCPSGSERIARKCTGRRTLGKRIRPRRPPWPRRKQAHRDGGHLRVPAQVRRRKAVPTLAVLGVQTVPSPRRMGAAGRRPSKRRLRPAPRTLPTESRASRRRRRRPCSRVARRWPRVAGAAVLTTRSRRRRKVLGVPLPKRNGLKVDAQKVTEAITDAAKRTDRIGQRVSRVANGVQDVSETANTAVKKS